MFRTTKPNLMFWYAIKHKDPQTAAYALKDLQSSIETSLKELEAIGAYKNDDSYRASVIKVLNYIKSSAEKDYPMVIDYYIRAYKPEDDTKKVNKFFETYESTHTRNTESMESTLERFVKKYTPKNPIKHK